MFYANSLSDNLIYLFYMYDVTFFFRIALYKLLKVFLFIVQTLGINIILHTVF